MKKLLLATAVLASTTSIAIAQPDSLKPKQKLFEHQVGVQVNELVRQVLNFNDAPAAIDNPFLMTYSITHIKTGLGIRLGGGYNQQVFSENDGVTKRNNDNKSMQFRVGVEKMFYLSDRWTAGAGIDALYGKEDNYTITTVNSFDTVTTRVRSKINTLGGGAMGWLRYRISDKILLGTEASFYYRKGDFEQNITVTQKVPLMPGGGGGITTSKRTISENETTDGRFRVPVVLYLIVRF